MRTWIALPAVLALALPALAGTVTLHRGYGSGPVGEFDVRITAGSLDLQFDQAIPLATGSARFATFCLERDEVIGYDRPCEISISERALGGGLGGHVPGGGDPISPQTAFLYRSFARGILPGYDYGTGVGRGSSAAALQSAIWFLENEVPADGGFTYTPTAALAAAWFGEGAPAHRFVALAFANATPDLGGVRVMNIWYNAAHTKGGQSQLILVVPAPAAGLLGLLGLAVAAGAMRRRGV